MTGILTLTCAKCTKQLRLQAASREAGYRAARKMGWHIKDGKAVCKRCPK